MSRIRVALAEMPVLLRNIVQTILSTEPDAVEMEPRIVHIDGVDTADALGHTDVLILLESGAAASALTRTLYAHPRLRLIAIRDDLHGARLYELRPLRTELNDLSPASLLRAVHGAASSTELS